MIKRDSDNFAKVNGVVPLKRIELDIMLSKSSTIFAKHTQFPIMLAWACTIQTTFGADQFYVAVSRATALSKVSLIGDLKSDMIKGSASALLEYDRLRRYSNFLYLRMIQKFF